MLNSNDDNLIFSVVLVFILIFIRISISLTLIKSLRGALGASGISILSIVFSFFLIGDLSFLNNKLNLESFLPSLVITEIFIGIFIGLSTGLIFEIIPFTGRLFDTFRGVQFAEQIAPEMGQRDSELEVFGTYLTLGFFFTESLFNKFIEFIILVNNNFGVLSKNKVFNNTQSQIFNIFQDKENLIFHFINEIFYVSLFITLPVLILSLILEVGFSAISKVIPKYQIGADIGYLRAGSGVFILLIVYLNGETANQVIIKYLSDYIASLNSLFKI